MPNINSLDLESGSSQYASISDGSQTGLDITGDLTIELWIKFEVIPSVSGTNNSLISKFEDSASNNRSFFLRASNLDTLVLYISANGTSITTSQVSWTPTVATWHHVAVVYDASAGEVSFYIDGSQQGSTQTGANTSIYNSTASFLVGAFRPSAPLEFLDGLVDEVRIWNITRTGSEISNKRAVELVGNESGLVAYWKFNNNYLDETSNNNDLTSSGSPSFSSDVPFSVEYTKGDESSLPTNDNNLETTYTETDIDDVATANNVRVSQTGTNQYVLHQFKESIGSANSCNLNWEGQTTWPPASNPVLLQIYNRDTTTWETVDTDNTSSVNTDFVLNGNIADTTDYKDANGWISCRIYQQMTF